MMDKQTTEFASGIQAQDKQTQVELKDIVRTEKALRQLIPTPPKMLEKRIQTSLDYFSSEFIKHASVAALATASEEIAMQFVQCNGEGFSLKDEKTLTLPSITDLDTGQHVSASLYFIVAGIGHGLRINGVLEKGKAGGSRFEIRQLYFHCARAAARAQLWSHCDINDLVPTLKESPYALLHTENSNGETDLSPRGDGPGFIHQLGPRTLLLPERPGNKVAVSLRNILQTSKVGLLLIRPGSNQTLVIRGNACITSNASLLKQCAVNQKAPKLGIVIDITDQHLQHDTALQKSNLWRRSQWTHQKTLTPFPKALSAHMNGTGLLGKATTGLVTAVVNRDMKNLY